MPLFSGVIDPSDSYPQVYSHTVRNLKLVLTVNLNPRMMGDYSSLSGPSVIKR